jgi:DNA-binding NtrC family response regulator
MQKVWVVDDDPEIQVIFGAFLRKQGFEVEQFEAALPALDALKRRAHPDLILCDLKLPDVDGLTFLDLLREKGASPPVIFVTAHGSTETAVESLRRGAFDYITKPINFTELGVLIERAIRIRKLEENHRQLEAQLARSQHFGRLIGKSQAMQRLFDLIERVARVHSSVLIQGESGTGKEVVARTIHDRSPRAQRPFVAVNCAAIPDALLEAELFGHAKGAFTGAIHGRRGLFAEADGGTIFLDEIGDMPLHLQAKLLRVLQEKQVKPVGEDHYKEVDVRVVAATHRDLRQGIRDGKFRDDLYYRLAVIPVSIPPLRERKDDIPILAGHFLSKYSELTGSRVKGFTQAAVAKMIRLPWPGNVRELENAIERAIVLCQTDRIEEDDLVVDDGVLAVAQAAPSDALFEKLPELRDLEREYMAYVLRITGGRKEKAARILGVDRKTLYRKVREFGFEDASAELT